MVKHTKTICRLLPTADKMFECVDHFVGLALKGLSRNVQVRGAFRTQSNI